MVCWLMLGWEDLRRHDVALEEQIGEPLEHLGKEYVLFVGTDDLDGDHASPGRSPVKLEAWEALVVVEEVGHSQVEDGLVDVELWLSGFLLEVL